MVHVKASGSLFDPFQHEKVERIHIIMVYQAHDGMKNLNSESETITFLERVINLQLT